jgi:hypothetical protein
MHEIDYRIHGDDMQFVEVELDPREAALSSGHIPARFSQPTPLGLAAPRADVPGRRQYA